MNEDKKTIAQREEETLKFWKENGIFEKSLTKPAPQGEFVFYEGPPTANGKPGIHHLEARAFKDAIPRYKTMRGYHVRRKGGWDTHGLPVELQVEKELGLKSKKEIEDYGIGKFNAKCRESVWQYVDLWRKFTDRIGFWVDLENPYVTYSASYVEALWAILKRVDEQKLLYKDYKVVPWCPRCGTVLSSHELAQGYENVKDLSVYVKFSIINSQFSKGDKKMYLLAWTTTPWTLPGNVALAVGKDVEYAEIEVEGKEERYILAKARLSVVKEPYKILKEYKGAELVGVEYEPLYGFLKESLEKNPSTNQNSVLLLGKGELRGEAEKLKNAFKVYEADFVTTTDGTGIVHAAVMYGQDDFELGTKVGLPKYHLVNEDGTFKKEAGFLAGKFVRDEQTAVDIIKDLAGRGLLFAKEKYEHSYPFCWRCHTPLIYYARDSWYIAVSKLREKLVKENKKIHWEPEYIKDGRFGEWLADVKDWAISRERYWGTPLPVWHCESCSKREVMGSYDQLRLRSGGIVTKFLFMRHGESEKNIQNLLSSAYEGYPLTKAGRARAKDAAKLVAKENIAAIYASPVLRTRETAEIIASKQKIKVVQDDRLREVGSGVWDEKHYDDVAQEQGTYCNLSPQTYYETPRGGTGESWKSVEERTVAFLKEALEKHKGKTVLVVSHEGPLAFLMRYLRDVPIAEVTGVFRKGLVNGYAVPKAVFVDKDSSKEFNPHRPNIDAVELSCDCGGRMKRVKEVVDVWFDSGAMPFAQDADSRGSNSFEEFWKRVSYPADFISEAIDQTRGWFYTLHAIGSLLGKGRAYENVICLGHILDAEGKKMSKSVGNVVDPWAMLEKYGSDALRLWMYSVNQPGESKNFDERSVDEIVKKVLNRLDNVLQFYKIYASADSKLSIFPASPDPAKRDNYQFSKKPDVLDAWILARLNQLTQEVTGRLDEYRLFEPVRAIKDFVDDLSVWYLRRSRERIKNGGEDGNAALGTLRFVLLGLSKLLAPFAPFFAEYLYKEAGGEKESVHLESWPMGESTRPNAQLRGGRGIRNHESRIIQEMEEVRRIVSLALEQRAKANIKVRQPLAKLKVKSLKFKIGAELSELIKDEVNVKEVVFDAKLAGEVGLDTTITPELKEEGQLRELVRAIQELRKEGKFQPEDKVRLDVAVEGEAKGFLDKHREALMRQTNLSEIVFKPELSGTELSVDSMRFVLAVSK